MSDLLARLVDRSVRPGALGAPTLQPRQRSRFERRTAGVDLATPAAIVEEHDEVPASPPANEQPERPPAALTARVSAPNLPTGSRSAPRTEPIAPVVAPAAVDVSMPDEPGRRTEPPVPSSPEPDADARVEPALEPAGPDGSRAPAPSVREVHSEPVIERVVELRRVPGPIVVVERPSRREPAPHRRPARLAPGGGRRPESRERQVAVEGRDPLVTGGLERLRPVEVIDHPDVGEAIDGSPGDAAPIHVHIGRLEVQRAVPPTPTPPRRRAPAPTIGLDQYLAEHPTRRSPR